MWLRVAIRYSISRIVPNYRVHELKDIPIAPEWEFNRRSNRYIYRGLNDRTDNRWGYQGLAGEDRTSWISQADKMNLQPSRLFGEVDGGRDIYPTYDHPHSSDGAPVWEVEVNEDVKVCAAPMSHSVPCVGYVIEEKSKPGRLRSELVTPIVKRNLNALKEAGFTVPMKVLGVIKNLPAGSSFTFPDGTVVTEQEAVEPPKKGRKVVICGDTASARAIEGELHVIRYVTSSLRLLTTVLQGWQWVQMLSYTKPRIAFCLVLTRTPICRRSPEMQSFMGIRLPIWQANSRNVFKRRDWL